MELDGYIRLITKWLWLIVITTVLAGVVAYYLRSQQPTIYIASSKVQIGNVLDSANPDASAFRLGLDLVQTYAEVVKTTNILQKTIDALKLPITPAYLRSNVTVSLIDGTAILTITVTNPDPQTASALANELAHELVVNSPTNLTDDELRQSRLLQDQIDQLAAQIADSEERLVDLDERLDAAQSAVDIANYEARRNVLVEQMGNARATLAQFSLTLANLQVRRNSVEIIEEAQGPGIPLANNVLGGVLVAVVSVAALTTGAIILFEYLDDRVKTIDDVERLLTLPVLSVIRSYRKRDSKNAFLFTDQKLPPDVEESYHWLSARLTSGSGHTTATAADTFVITSPWADDGKSTTIANLAIMMALTGRRVVLLDADLRRPTLHQLFKLDNTKGLTSLLTMRTGESEESDRVFVSRLASCVQQTRIPTLRIITSGPLKVMSPKLLDACITPTWVDLVTRTLDTDVILFDTPPCLVVTDACSLAAKTNASAVVVLHAGRARIGSVKRAKEVLNQFGVNITGVVLNKASVRETARYSY